ncbi:hypothetical protein EDB81DRAFT_791432 [Dactylonectria macrodidyma]|uniref:DUF4396 domain-containing protein n=1 Tax=Dactylonectria macrodidyma TaxID=307937 RepID=A0A9P9F719_9HYPO|nr:hypothetical protein EDB81DRAFT_791432 [Dactylonectria macrodidyma]
MAHLNHAFRLCGSRFLRPTTTRLMGATPVLPRLRSYAPVLFSTSARHWTKATTCQKTCHKSTAPQNPQLLSISSLSFWSSRPTWNRASVNTLRCLVGCTLGDFAAMWMLQLNYPELGMGIIMPISMISGISTSILLETVLLRIGRDGLPWLAACKTAIGMSFISMITMEIAENAVDYYLTGGAVSFDSPGFWIAALVSMTAGFFAPLPYNYIRLRKFGKACH